MAVLLLSSMASPFVPAMRAVYKIDGDDAALLAYLDEHSALWSTGAYRIDRSGPDPVLLWTRYVYDPDVHDHVLGTESGAMILPAPGAYVIATGAVYPPTPTVFDPLGWWPCDTTGHPLDARALQSATKVSKTRVAVGRTTLTTGAWTAGQSTDLPIVFDTPAVSAPDSGWVQIQPGVAWMGKTRATVKDGSLTTTGCTVTVTFLAAVSLSSAQPINYEAVCLYSFLADA